jgi:Sap, sulfolipid-1-addressing protein
MGSVIGEILPLALGIPISPIPIIAAILMLLSPKAKATSVGFMLGWICGIVVARIVFVLLASILPQSESNEPQPIAGIVKILLGVLMVFLSLKQWRARPHDDVEPPMPNWMLAIDSMTAGRASAWASYFRRSTRKPLDAAAGVTIGSAPLSVSSAIALRSSSRCRGLLGHRAGDCLLSGLPSNGRPLESLRGWLVHNNATVMAVLLLVIGVSVIGKGIGNL